MLCTMRINRNILECKLYSPVLKCRTVFVLIETYWNVNDDKLIKLGREKEFVLIETYWNVNASALLDIIVLG